MAVQILTFETIRDMVRLTVVSQVSYHAGWEDAMTGRNRNIGKPSRPEATTLSPSVSELHVEPVQSAAVGPFYNDPTWDSFTQNIEDYRAYINSIEE